jgi:hypothetical protein
VRVLLRENGNPGVKVQTVYHRLIIFQAPAAISWIPAQEAGMTKRVLNFDLRF